MSVTFLNSLVPVSLLCSLRVATFLCLISVKSVLNIFGFWQLVRQNKQPENITYRRLIDNKINSSYSQCFSYDMWPLSIKRRGIWGNVVGGFWGFPFALWREVQGNLEIFFNHRKESLFWTMFTVVSFSSITQADATYYDRWNHRWTSVSRTAFLLRNEQTSSSTRHTILGIVTIVLSKPN